MLESVPMVHAGAVVVLSSCPPTPSPSPSPSPSPPPPTDQADIKVTAVSVEAPDQVAPGEPFGVIVHVSVHNNGPVQQVQGEGGAGVGVPPDCTRNPPAGYQLINPITLPSSVTLEFSKTFEITCNDPGAHEFIGCGRAGPLPDQAQDPERTNNFKWITFPVDVAGEGSSFYPNRCSILGDPPETCDNGIDDDQDGFVDEEPDDDRDGLSNCADADDDGDGYEDAREAFLGTDPLSACARHTEDAAWPPDFSNDRFVTVTDILAERDPFGTSVGAAGYESRADLTADGSVNISDVLYMKQEFGTQCGSMSASIAAELCGNNFDEDQDGLVDEEPDSDADGSNNCDDVDDDDDAYSDSLEQFVVTDPLAACALHAGHPAWPPDFNNDRSVSVTDVLTLRDSFGTASTDPGYITRRDLNADRAINISDVLALKADFGASC